MGRETAHSGRCSSVACRPWGHTSAAGSSDRDTADDIVQEVSLRTLAGDGPRNPTTFASWACGIARNVIGVEWRRRRRLRAEQPLEPLSLDDIRDPIATPDLLCDARVSLKRAIDADTQRVVLLLRRHVDKLTSAELARELGVSPDALRMRLMRARLHARARRDDP